jgi:hypothetical protein
VPAAAGDHQALAGNTAFDEAAAGQSAHTCPAARGTDTFEGANWSAAESPDSDTCIITGTAEEAFSADRRRVDMHRSTADCGTQPDASDTCSVGGGSAAAMTLTGASATEAAPAIRS